MTGRAHEVNFDGLVGPTHNYAGLSHGNLASQKHKLDPSNPREAALQGLAKMKYLHDLGLKQAVLPPQERPEIRTLRRAGFSGSDADVLWQASRQDPVLLTACCSASSMWAANAATVSPGADAADGRVHFTPANLVSQFHRSLEPPLTARVLRRIFADESAFAHHDPLPAGNHLGDEGAANHMRLARAHGEPGIEVFAFGKSASDVAAAGPARFPARQSREASEAIARLDGLDPDRTIFVRQHPAAIDAGVFHNDVVAVANENVLLYHAAAWAETPVAVGEARRKLSSCGGELIAIEIRDHHVPLREAVETYLFNSQLVTLPDGAMTLIAPIECQEHARVRGMIDQIVSGPDNPIRSVHYLDVRQSMKNGGGPACLRLRVVLTEPQLGRALPSVFLSDALYRRLVQWVERHYREQLGADDLADPKLLEESRRALDELTGILGLGTLYEFQGATLFPSPGTPGEGRGPQGRG